jgi:anaerobic selenocysteine-containing dehydrogenase
VRNGAHFSSPMVDPPAGMRHDWEAIGGLTTRVLARGTRGPGGRIAGRMWGLALRHLGAEGLLDLGLRAGPYGAGAALRGLLGRGRPQGVPRGGLTLKHLKAHPHGVDLGPLQPRLPERLYTDDKRIRLVDPIYAADLARLRASRDADTDGLVLIGRRHLRSNNSWMHNSPRLVKGPARCTLMIHPDDAAARGLTDGEEAVVASRSGEITVPVEITDTVMPGVVSVPHGWGHDRDGVGWSTARAHAGVSVNDVTDDAFLDELTGTSALNGVTVEVRAATPAAPELAAAGAS